MTSIGDDDFASFVRERANQVPPFQVERPSAYGEVIAIERAQGAISVQVKDTGDIIQAERAGFPPGWEYQVGDLLSVEFREGAWKTMPDMTEVRHLGNGREYWVSNGVTKKARKLAFAPYEESQRHGNTK